MGQQRPLEMWELSEKQWTAQVKELASLMGWRRYHTFLATHSPAGFPDEVLVRDRLIFAELKKEPPWSKREPRRRLLSAVHRLSDAQREWLDDLVRVGQECYVWTPSDYDDMAAVLRVRLGDRMIPEVGSRWTREGRADGREV